MKKYIAEFMGTLMLTLIACGIAVISGNYLGIALGFGLVVIAMAYSIGNVSGAHINPAVSLGFALTGQMTWMEFGNKCSVTACFSSNFRCHCRKWYFKYYY